MAGPSLQENYDQNGLSSVYDHFGRNHKSYCGLVLFHDFPWPDLLFESGWDALQPFLIDPFRTRFIAY